MGTATMAKLRKPRVVFQAVEGPTIERLAKAQNHFHIGDDQRGGRVYQFHDTPLDRLYSRLTRAAKSTAAQDQLRREYSALMKYRNHFVRAGKETTIASIDLNSVHASNPSQRQGMPMAEAQVQHGSEWRHARSHIGHKPGIVVDNVVCSETSVQVAGWSIGYNSPFRAREGAEKILRESGLKLARYWGIN